MPNRQLSVRLGPSQGHRQCPGTAIVQPSPGHYCCQRRRTLVLKVQGRAVCHDHDHLRRHWHWRQLQRQCQCHCRRRRRRVWTQTVPRDHAHTTAVPVVVAGAGAARVALLAHQPAGAAHSGVGRRLWSCHHQVRCRQSRLATLHDHGCGRRKAGVQMAQATKQLWTANEQQSDGGGGYTACCRMLLMHQRHAR